MRTRDPGSCMMVGRSVPIKDIPCRVHSCVLPGLFQGLEAAILQLRSSQCGIIRAR
jgi:hypothetical protein